MRSITHLASIASLRRRHVFVIGAILLTACHDDTPARLELPTDTLVINSTDWTPFHLAIFNKRGEPITGAHVSYDAKPDSLIQVRTDGTIWCQGNGSGQVVVRSAALESSFPVRCDLVRRFSVPHATLLIAGGPPVPLDIQAYDERGRVMNEARLRLTVEDTTIVRLHNGMVFGLKPGATGISVRTSGRDGGQVFFVRRAPATLDSISPAPPTRPGPKR